MTIRRTWTERSIRVNRATRSRPVAEVGSTEKYMEDQSVGAVRTGTAVPTDKIRRNPRSVVTKRRWPAAILDKTQFFLADRRARRGPWASGRPGLRAVVWRGRGKRRRQRVAYWISISQRIKPRFPFRKIAERYAGPEFNNAFPFALQRALETAK